jgi:hypothetical protein
MYAVKNRVLQKLRQAQMSDIVHNNPFASKRATSLERVALNQPLEFQNGCFYPAMPS